MKFFPIILQYSTQAMKQNFQNEKSLIGNYGRFDEIWIKESYYLKGGEYPFWTISISDITWLDAHNKQ